VNVRRSFVRFVALTVVVAMPVMGMSGIASAKTTKAAAKACAKHPKKCLNSGGGSSTGGTGAGTGGPPVDITVTASPNPLVETGQSEIHSIIQVETLPSFAGDVVSISSSQLEASCAAVYYTSIEDGFNAPVFDEITAVLDDDGNATVDVAGLDCAPGTSVIEASLENAPYLTALTTLVANPPVVTTAGLTGYPNDEVETGDSTNSGDSDVYAIFYVEDNPVYAEMPVEISSAQLEARCGGGWYWLAGNFGNNAGPGTGVNTMGPATTTLDDDGNAVFAFKGISCAAGDSQVIADVMAGSHDTFTFDYTIDPPAPTI
jgi:hypothetical protein